MPEVIMPKMGDAMTEGKILRWMKSPGDRVARGEAIAEIETDKVNVDLEAETDGVLAQILAEAGQSVPVGTAIAVIAGRGEAAPSGTPAAAAAGGPAKAPAHEVPARPAEARPAPSAQQPARAPAAAPSGQAPAAPGGGPAPAEAVRASPLARRLAQEHGIPLERLRGTGPEGRVTKEDVEAAAAAMARDHAPAAGAEAAGPSPAQTQAVRHGAPVTRDVALTRMRQTIARRMTESKQQVPHIYLTVGIAMDAALALRRELNEGADDARKVSVNDLVVRATALALRVFPSLNASFTERGIQVYEDINLSIGIALPDGLIAPTLYQCDQKTVWELAAESRALAERARMGRLRAEDLVNGTFTISNLGMFDVDVFSAIINPPQAAILAVGAAKPQAVVRDGQVAVGTVMQVTCAADHRVTDGAEVARFLAELRRLLEHPVWLVANRPDSHR